MKHLLIVIALFFIVSESYSCTTFLVSGKFTKDGRPLLFKHRDTGEPNNAVVKFSDGKFKYVGLVNADEKWDQEVWGGFNETGFGIMNSAAYNNNIGDTTLFKDQEGVVMKMALQNCASLKDFENLLDTLKKPLGVDANFGVIDATGGAAYYETGNFNYKKVDANNLLIAPHGYIVRTNYSFSGDIHEGYGYIRFEKASEVLYEAAAIDKLEPQYLFNNISRNLTHSLTGEDLSKNLPENSNVADYRFFNDFIPRKSSSASIMIVGAKEGGNPEQTMMWTIMGFPLTAMAVPVWISDVDLPCIVSMKEDKHAPLCDAAMELKKQCFPIERGSGWKYINRSVLLNKEGNGYLQLIQPAENFIFEKTEVLQQESFSEKTVKEHYQWLDKFIRGFYADKFEINLF